MSNFSRPDRTIEPTLTDLAYIAGLFDGEGSVTITRMGGAKNTMRLGVGICNTDMNCLIFVQKFYPSAISEMTRKKQKHRRIWRWSLEADRAMKFLLEVLPFLVIKKKQAELGIEYQRIRNLFKSQRPKDGYALRLGFSPVSKEESEFHFRFRTKMSNLNKRIVEEAEKIVDSR